MRSLAGRDEEALWEAGEDTLDALADSYSEEYDEGMKELLKDQLFPKKKSVIDFTDMGEDYITLPVYTAGDTKKPIRIDKKWWQRKGKVVYGGAPGICWVIMSLSWMTWAIKTDEDKNRLRLLISEGVKEVNDVENWSRLYIGEHHS